jgi:hypothetical protein
MGGEYRSERGLVEESQVDLRGQRRRDVSGEAPEDRYARRLEQPLAVAVNHPIAGAVAVVVTRYRDIVGQPPTLRELALNEPLASLFR